MGNLSRNCGFTAVASKTPASKPSRVNGLAGFISLSCRYVVVLSGVKNDVCEICAQRSP